MVRWDGSTALIGGHRSLRPSKNRRRNIYVVGWVYELIDYNLAKLWQKADCITAIQFQLSFSSPSISIHFHVYKPYYHQLPCLSAHRLQSA